MKTPPDTPRPILGYIANYKNFWARGTTAEAALEYLVNLARGFYERQIVEDGATTYAYVDTAKVQSVTRREFKWASP